MDVVRCLSDCFSSGLWGVKGLQRRWRCGQKNTFLIKAGDPEQFPALPAPIPSDPKPNMGSHPMREPIPSACRQATGVTSKNHPW